MKDISEMTVIQTQTMIFSARDWPEGRLEVHEEPEFVYDPDEDEPTEADLSIGEPKESINEFGTPRELSEYYEVQGEGQQRHWFKNTTQTCCGVAAGRWEGTQAAPCDKPDYCAYCRSSSTTAADNANGHYLRLTAAKLLLFSRQNEWGRLPDATIFEFTLELSNRLQGEVLKKELSHFAAPRCKQEDVFQAITQGKLMQYSDTPRGQTETPMVA